MNYDLSYREVSVDPVMELDMTANHRRKGFSPGSPEHLVTIGPHIRTPGKKVSFKTDPFVQNKDQGKF